MLPNQKIDLSPEIEDVVYNKFLSLPLKHKLIVYAKLVHGNSFKSQNNDIFGLNRRTVSSVYRTFIDSLRTDFNVEKEYKSKKSNSYSSKYKKKKTNNKVY